MNLNDDSGSVSPLIDNERVSIVRQIKGGLTKREYYAAMAMHGILSNSCRLTDISAQDQARISSKASLAFSDALIAALNEPIETESEEPNEPTSV